MLEGFAGARVLVAGLRRAKPLTRDNLRRALDGLGKLDLGGLRGTVPAQRRRKLTVASQVCGELKMPMWPVPRIGS
jgi:hypothetical protein